jgi:NhaP-type Na+/H+ or K+/H+ antiporter
LVVAAAVTPTDPILAQAVVGGPWAEQHVPAHLRHMLMCESGCNDGAAFPFLFLALFLTTHRDNRGKAIGMWFYDAWAYQIILGTFLGALIGFLARKAMRFSERHRLVDRESFVAQYVSLALASMGVGVLLGSDDLLGAFACGTAFAWDGWFTRQTEDSNFSNIVDLLFNTAAFIYIGALIPFHTFVDASIGLSLWRLIVVTLLTLLLKRLPIVLALWKWIPDIKTFREAIFAGWFGPIGAGAIFIATLARTELPEEIPEPPVDTNDVLAATIQPIIFFFVMCSILVHGLTIPFFAFSRHATTVTRTWSRAASISRMSGEGGGEPGWLNRVKRFRTNDTLKHEEGNMTEIERVLNAQLGVIGRGAIGGDAEKELREDRNGELSSSSGSGTSGEGSHSPTSGSHVGLMNTRTQRDLEKADLDRRFNDDPEDYEDEHNADPSCEWGGDSCIEARRYREKLAAAKAEREARQRREGQLEEGDERRRSAEAQQDGEEGDIGGAATSHDLEKQAPEAVEEDEERAPYHNAQSGYPSVRSWVEGNKLLLEYQKTRSDDPEVHVLNLTDADVEAVRHADSPAHAWVRHHAEGIEEHLGITEHHQWDPTEAVRNVIHHGIPNRYNAYLESRKNGAQSSSSAAERGRPAAQQSSMSRDDSHGEDSRQERAERTALIYGAMSAASGRRDASDERAAARQPAKSASARFAEDPIHSRSASGSRSPDGRHASGAHAHKLQVHAAGTDSVTAKRRFSLRKRLLAGQVGLQGRRSKSHSERLLEDEDEAEDYIIEDPTPESSRPTSIFLSGNSGGSGLGLPRTDSLPTGAVARTFYRTTSHGGLAGDEDSGQRSNTVQWVNAGDTRHERSSRAPGASKPNSRSTSPARAAAAAASDSRHSKTLNRNRTISNASLRDAAAQDDGEREQGDQFGSQSGRGGPRRGGRVAALFSALTPGPRPRTDRGGSAPPESDSSRLQHASSSPAIARFMARPGTAESNGPPERTGSGISGISTPSETGILAGGANSTAASSLSGHESDRVMIELPGRDGPVFAGGPRDSDA